MRILGAALLPALLSAAAAVAVPGAFVAYDSPQGRFSCELPRGLSAAQTVERGIVYTEISPGPPTTIDIDVHPMTLIQRLKNYPAAEKYASSLISEPGTRDFQVVRPLERGFFRRDPAWTITRQYTFGLETLAPNTARLETRDTYMVVQRPADFVVVIYRTRPSYFSDHLPVLQHVLETLEFAPTPAWSTPSGLRALAGLAAAVVVLLAGLLVRKARQRAATDAGT